MQWLNGPSADQMNALLQELEYRVVHEPIRWPKAAPMVFVHFVFYDGGSSKIADTKTCECEI